jgi:hypothetical protein
MRARTALASLALLALFTGCGGSKCANPVIASWHALGSDLQSESTVFGPRGTTFDLWLDSCGGAATVAFTELPYPPAPGTYPLRWRPSHGLATNGFAGATYSVSFGANYFTDATGPDSNGSVVLTSVDSAAKKMSGTFSFHATDDSGTKSVDVTRGVLDGVPYL